MIEEFSEWEPILGQLLEQAPGFWAVFEGPQHIFKLANRAYRGLVGSPILIGQPVRGAFPELKSHPLFERLDEVYATGVPYEGHRVPLRVLDPKTQAPLERFLDFVYQPVTRGDGTIIGIICEGHDVTSLVQSEQSLDAKVKQLALERQMFDTALSFTEDFNYIFDTQGRFTYVNKALLSLWGLTLDQAVGKTFAELPYEPDLARTLSEEVATVVRTRSQLRAQTKYRSPNGKDGWYEYIFNPVCDPSGTVIFVAGSTRDVSAHIRQEEKLLGLMAAEQTARAEANRDRNRLRAQFMRAPVAVFTLQGPDLVFELANPAYVQMVGGRQLEGKTFRDAFPEVPDDAPVFQMMKDVFRTGKTFVADEYRVALTRIGGEPTDAYFLFTCQAIYDATGRVEGVMGVAVDVTAHVVARKTVEALMIELRQADQRKDEFLAMLGHELRNPLNALTTALALGERNRAGAGPDLEASRLREICTRQVRNLVHMVDDLLDVSRISSGNVVLRKQPLHLEEVVRSAMESTRSIFQARNHALSLQIAPGPYFIEADSTRLEQVLSNLLLNAAKYTPPGGQIALRITREAVGQSPWATIRITDNGVGIAPEMLSRVFDLFVQADNSLERTAGGLGIGLTLVKGLVEMHGGTVTASSAGLGAGSQFSVRLPLNDGLFGSNAASPPAGSHATAERRRVLLVEDSEDARETFRLLLEDMGHEVAVAEDGLQAVKMLLEVLPDVALVDVGLPGIDGYEVARRVRAEPKGRELYLVALTGYGGPEAQAKARNAGFDLHVVKPIDLDNLDAILKRPAPK